MTEITVTQEDREAAILLVEIIQDSGFDWSVNLTRLVDGVSEYTLTYHGDVSIHPDTSEAYARLHQLQAEEKAAAALDFIQTIRHEARKAALEEAAGIAEDHALRAWEIGEAEGQNAICSSGRNHGARAIATAIRSAVGGE